MDQPADPLLGTTFAGRYRIERLLGAGGMGCVYTATQLSMNREVALKVLNPDVSASDSAAQRFHREMRATSKVEHACTIRVYDFGRSDDGRLFLAMELLDGRTLHAALREVGAFSTSRQLRIAEQIARALGAAHTEGIVHRDLKPENIMLLDRYGEHDVVKVLDFGIARFAAGNEPDKTPQLTKAGTLIGTPLYMSPEQAQGHPVDHRSDIYSLGVLMYQMATGVPPFTDPQPVRVLFMHAQQIPKPANEVAGGRLPARLDALISQMLAKSPDERPQTTAEVIHALQRCTEANTQLDGQTIPAPKSRLGEDPEAMARARAGHADPQSLVATVQEDIESDAPADVMEDTIVSVGPECLGDGGMATAPTILADATETAEAIVAAETLIAPASTLPTSPSPAVVARVSSPPAAVLTPNVGSKQDEARTIDNPTAAATGDEDLEPPAETDGDAVDAASMTERVQLPGPQTVVTDKAGEPSAGRPWLGPAVGGVVLLTGLGIWLTGHDGPEAPVEQPAIEVAPATPAAAQAPPPAPEVGPLRDKLNALTAAAGDPVAPKDCQLTDAPALKVLVHAHQLLADGRPRSMRPADVEAVGLIRAVTATHGEQAEVATAHAKALLFSGKGSDPKIEHEASRAAKGCANWGQPHELIGRVHLLGDRPEAAARHFNEALRHAPTFTRARYNLGLATLGSKDVPGALLHFDHILKGDASHRMARLARGQAHLMAGAPEKAVADLERLTKDHADDAKGWYLLGGAYDGAKRQSEAEKAWCKASELGHKAAAKLCPTAGI